MTTTTKHATIRTKAITPGMTIVNKGSALYTGDYPWGVVASVESCGRNFYYVHFVDGRKIRCTGATTWLVQS